MNVKLEAAMSKANSGAKPPTASEARRRSSEVSTTGGRPRRSGSIPKPPRDVARGEELPASMKLHRLYTITQDEFFPDLLPLVQVWSPMRFRNERSVLPTCLEEEAMPGQRNFGALQSTLEKVQGIMSLASKLLPQDQTAANDRLAEAKGDANPSKPQRGGSMRRRTWTGPPWPIKPTTGSGVSRSH